MKKKQNQGDKLGSLSSDKKSAIKLARDPDKVIIIVDEGTEAVSTKVLAMEEIKNTPKEPFSIPQPGKHPEMPPLNEPVSPNKFPEESPVENPEHDPTVNPPYIIPRPDEIPK